jgi:hypothetical protein
MLSIRYCLLPKQNPSANTTVDLFLVIELAIAMAFTKYLLPALAAAGTVLGTPNLFHKIETKLGQDVCGSSLKNMRG